VKLRQFLPVIVIPLALACGNKNIQDTPKAPEGNPVIELRQGNQLLAQKRCAEAIKVYQDFLAKYPKDSGGWNLLGLAFLCDGKVDQAIPALQQALVLSPGFTDVRNNLGVAFMEAKRYPEAREEFMKALADTQYPAAAPYFNLAKLALQQESYEEARAIAKKAMTLAPTEQGPRVLYALALEKLGRYDEALSAFREAAAKNPENVEVQLHIGSILLQLNQDCEARTYLNKVLDADPLGELGQQAIALLKQAECKK
jgi:Flp pilus assembly protein TadD